MQCRSYLSPKDHRGVMTKMSNSKLDVEAIVALASSVREGSKWERAHSFEATANRVIASIGKVAKSLEEFLCSPEPDRDRLRRLFQDLSSQQITGDAHTFTLLRTLRNRVQRLKLNAETEDDVRSIVALGYRLEKTELFLEDVA